MVRAKPQNTGTAGTETRLHSPCHE